MVHFFGINCDKDLTFEQFSNFVSNFQHEVLKFEFKQYSGGEIYLRGPDFAEMVLKYTKLNPEMENNIKSKVSSEIKVTFDDFEVFVQMLNNIEDFEVAVKFFGLLGKQPLGQEELKKAAKICLNGKDLPNNIIEILFSMFDIEGNFLSFSFMILILGTQDLLTFV